jgi:hypothetical protein
MLKKECFIYTGTKREIGEANSDDFKTVVLKSLKTCRACEKKFGYSATTDWFNLEKPNILPLINEKRVPLMANNFSFDELYENSKIRFCSKRSYFDEYLNSKKEVVVIQDYFLSMSLKKNNLPTASQWDLCKITAKKRSVSDKNIYVIFGLEGMDIEAKVKALKVFNSVLQNNILVRR